MFPGFSRTQSRDRFLSHRPPKSALICGTFSAKPETVPVTNPLIPLTPDQSFTAIHPSLLCSVRYHQSGPTVYLPPRQLITKKCKTKPIPETGHLSSGQPKLDPGCDTEAPGPQKSVTLAPSAWRGKTGTCSTVHCKGSLGGRGGVGW